jgi:hypothetical protein
MVGSECASALCSSNDVTFTPRAGSSTSVIFDAQRPHNHKCRVWRCGLSSNGAEFSSLAATEIETTSNWNNRPSEKEYKGRLQPSLTQCANIAFTFTEHLCPELADLTAKTLTSQYSLDCILG